MREHLIILFVLFGSLCAGAQDMKSVFVAMPDSIAPLLTKVNREDCIDFLASDMKAEVTNRFGGKSEMKMLTEDYTFVQMTSNSTLEMKLLSVNDSTKVVCVVKTVCAPACDSYIRFYASDWSKEMDSDAFLQLPEADDFFMPDEILSEEEALIRKKADMHLMKASLAQDDLTITFIYTTPDYLNKEDREKLSLHLRKEPLVFRWKSQRFE